MYSQISSTFCRLFIFLNCLFTFVLCSLHLKLEIKTPAIFEICVQSLIKTIFNLFHDWTTGFIRVLSCTPLSSISTNYGIFIYLFTNFYISKLKKFSQNQIQDSGSGLKELTYGLACQVFTKKNHLKDAGLRIFKKFKTI